MLDRTDVPPTNGNDFALALIVETIVRMRFAMDAIGADILANM